MFDVSCGSVVDESELGCTVQLYIPPGAPQPYNASLLAINSTASRVRLAYPHRTSVVVVLGTVDGARNAGANITLVWTVDSEVPWAFACANLHAYGSCTTQSTRPQRSYAVGQMGCLPSPPSPTWRSTYNSFDTCI